MPKKDQKNWFNIEANASKTHADIYIYGVVGGWQVNIQRFREELKQHKNLKTLNVYISSVGGTFMDGLPIYNELKQHSAHITTINMGYALSMGSVIMLAGDTIQMAQNALIMIHSPNTFHWDYGNARDFRKIADTLDMHEKAMLPRYRQRMNLSESEVVALLHAETWYDADAAKAAGLIDEILDPIDFDEVEEEMTEDHWRETVAQLRNPPPANFLSRLSLHLPDAKTIFKGKTLAPASGDDSEDDIMTPEQQADIKAHFDASVDKAVTAATAGLYEKLQAAIAKALPTAEAQEATAQAQTAAAEKINTTISGVSAKLDTATTKLGEIAEGQVKQSETLAEAKTVLDEVKAIPVNKPRVQPITDGDEPKPQPAYS